MTELRKHLLGPEPGVVELEPSRMSSGVEFLVLALPEEALLLEVSSRRAIREETRRVSQLLREERGQEALGDELSGRLDELDSAKDALRETRELETHLRSDLEELGRGAQAVSEAVADLPRSDLVASLYTIALQAQTLTRADYAALGIGNDPTKPFRPWIALGVSPGVARAIGRDPRPVGLLGAVARDGEVLRVADLREHPKFVGLPRSHVEMGPFLGVPIRYRDRSVGNLYLARRCNAPAFTEADERIVRLLASRVGAAVETARVYAGERLERWWLQNLIEQMPNGVLLYDARGRFKAMNQAAAALRCEPTGRTDVFGNPVILDVRELDGTPVASEDLPVVRVLREEENIIRREALLHGRDGQRTPVAISAVLVRDLDGRVVGVTMIVDDISIQTDIHRLREEWTAVVAHDLRQPVSVIALAADALARRHAGELSDLDRRALDRIRGASSRLNRMISDLTQASLIESKQLSVDTQLVDMARFIETTLENLDVEVTGFELRANVETETWAWIDHERIQQVLTNLVTNAAKYGEVGTSILVDVRASDDTVEVVVTNHGRGIQPDQIPHLFSRFSRTREARSGNARGLGLGLYIAKGLVEAHGGRIWAESIPGETTSFHFTLRRGQPPRLDAQAAAESRPSG